MRRILPALVCLCLPALSAGEVPNSIGPYRLGRKAAGDHVEATLFACKGEVFARRLRGKVADIVFTSHDCDLDKLVAELGKPQGGGRGVSVWRTVDRMLVYDDDTGDIHLTRRNDRRACLAGDGFDAFLVQLRKALADDNAAAAAKLVRFPFDDHGGPGFRTRKQFLAGFDHAFPASSREEILRDDDGFRCDFGRDDYSLSGRGFMFRIERVGKVWRFTGADPILPDRGPAE